MALGRAGMALGRAGMAPGRVGMAPGRAGMAPGRAGMAPGRAGAPGWLLQEESAVLRLGGAAHSSCSRSNCARWSRPWH